MEEKRSKPSSKPVLFTDSQCRGTADPSAGILSIYTCDRGPDSDLCSLPAYMFTLQFQQVLLEREKKQTWNWFTGTVKCKWSLTSFTATHFGASIRPKVPMKTKNSDNEGLFSSESPGIRHAHPQRRERLFPFLFCVSWQNKASLLGSPPFFFFFFGTWLDSKHWKTFLKPAWQLHQCLWDAGKDSDSLWLEKSRVRWDKACGKKSLGMKVQKKKGCKLQKRWMDFHMYYLRCHLFISMGEGGLFTQQVLKRFGGQFRVCAILPKDTSATRREVEIKLPVQRATDASWSKSDSSTELNYHLFPTSFTSNLLRRVKKRKKKH